MWENTIFLANHNKYRIISADMATKRKNRYVWVQPLRLAVQLSFLTAMVFAGFNTKIASEWMLPSILLLGVLFCGWVCPFGAAQDWMSKLGRLLRLPRLRVPQGVQQYMQLSRYILLILLTLEISFSLLQGPKHFSMMVHGAFYSAGTALVLSFLILGLFTDRPFCNYVCTGGAKMGFLSVLRIFGIRRDTEQCGQCGQCTRQCPMNIDVAQTAFVRHPNCIGCMSCVTTCPKNCLRYTLAPAKKEKVKGKTS